MNQIEKKRSAWSWIPTLYFAEGLPYVAVMTVAVIMYKKMGLTNTQIALYTSWLYLPWVIKPLWSPFIDLIKTKRWWVNAMQTLIAAAFAGVAFFIPTTHWVQVTLAFFWLLAFASATHDIAADGFYLHGLQEKEQSFFVGIRNTFYRVAMIFGQGLLVMFAGWVEQGKIFPNLGASAANAAGSSAAAIQSAAEGSAAAVQSAAAAPDTVAAVVQSAAAAVPGAVEQAAAGGNRIALAWSLAFYLLAGIFLALTIYHRFILPKPASDAPRKDINARTIWRNFATTFVSFFQKPHMGLMLFFLLTYRLGESQLVKIAQPFMLDDKAAGGLALTTLRHPGRDIAVAGRYPGRNGHFPRRFQKMDSAYGAGYQRPRPAVRAAGVAQNQQRAAGFGLRGAGAVRLRFWLYGIYDVSDLCGPGRAQDGALCHWHRIYGAGNDAARNGGRLDF